MAFMRQVGTVASGAALGQLILLAATPFLARIYTPAEFGQYAVFLALYFVTLVIGCMRLEFAIPLATAEEAPAVVWLAMTAGIVVAIVLGLLALAGAPGSILPQANTALGWLALCAPLVAIVQTAMYVTIREARFRSNTLLRTVQPAAFVALALLTSTHGLILCHVISVAIAAAVAGTVLASYLKPVARSALAAALARFKSHPLLSLPSTLLDTLSLACPIFVISAAYGSDVLGNYSQLQRIMAAPLLLMVIALSDVFFKHAADRVRDGAPLRPLVLDGFRKLALLAVVLFATAAFIGSDLARLLLGAQWRTDTLFVLLVLSPALVRMCVSPLTNVFLATGRVPIATRWQAAYFVITYATLPLLASNLPIEKFLVGYLVLETVMYGIYLALAMRVTPAPRVA